MEVIGLYTVLLEDKKANLLKEENKMVSDCSHLLKTQFALIPLSAKLTIFQRGKTAYCMAQETGKKYTKYCDVQHKTVTCKYLIGIHYICPLLKKLQFKFPILLYLEREVFVCRNEFLSTNEMKCE